MPIIIFNYKLFVCPVNNNLSWFTGFFGLFFWLLLVFAGFTGFQLHLSHTFEKLRRTLIIRLGNKANNYLKY